ncbi:MAG: hypothetical protein U0804_24060 [Gemmataceae bacterium]
MFRRLLAIYMTFVLVAGPSLCCCTTAVASAPPSGSGSSLPPSHRPSPCCCRDECPTKSQHPLGGGSPAEQAPKPGKHQCPCKDSGTKQTLDQPAPSLTAEEVARLLTATFQFVPAALTTDPVVDPDLDSGGGSSPPGHRLTSWRLLQAHHLLRC